MNSYVVYGQDGDYISEEIMNYFQLAPHDYKYDKEVRCFVYDFVGFVFKGERILAVFPKRYFVTEELEDFNSRNVFLEDDIRLLYKSIIRYSDKKKRNVKAESYLGQEDNFVSDYPFFAFYEIYKYYREYGLYKEQEEILQSGLSGKVSWKKTIQKAQILISEGNIIYLPIYVKKYNMYADFITDCMAYIIDYTIKFFACFISLPRTMQKNSGFNYLENIEFVLRRLYETRRSIHKDISKKLIDNMILFFKQYKMNCMGGNLHIKVNYFNFVWEDAVNQYLNAYFKKFDQKTNSIVFDLKQKHSAVKFKKVSYLVDESGNRFEIELDHYGIEGKKLYIFDSKYYQYLKALNYKQYAYDEILRYSKPEIDELYSVLLLPGVKPAGIHFELKKEFQGNRKFGNIITEQYLCVKDVLQHYIQT